MTQTEAVSKEYRNVTAIYEFMAGINKLYQPAQNNLLPTLRKICILLKLFKDTEVYHDFIQLGIDLKKGTQLPLVTSLDFEKIKDTCRTIVYPATGIAKITDTYFDNLHQLMLGNMSNQLAGDVLRYGQYRNLLKAKMKRQIK